MSLRHTMIPALAFLVALTGCGADDGRPIEIAVAGPLELANGRSMQLAAELAVEEINRAGGIDGRPLSLLFRDDGGSPERAISIAAELRDDTDVVAVVGHVHSAASLAASSVYNDGARGLMAISPASSSPALTDAGPWTFRVCPTDLQHGPALAEWARGPLDAGRATIIYENDAYGRGLVETFEETFERGGGHIASRDPYLAHLIEADGRVEPYLERALRNDTEVLMIAGQAGGAGPIVAAARRLGYDGPIMGADGLTNITALGSLGEGIFVSSAFLPDRPDAAAQEFVSAYRERYAELPDHRGAMTYDVVYLLARALDEVGTGRSALRDYVAGVGSRSPAFDGVSGTIAFDENGDVEGKDVVIGVVRGGGLVTAGTGEGVATR